MKKTVERFSYRNLKNKVNKSKAKNIKQFKNHKGGK